MGSEVMKITDSCRCFVRRTLSEARVPSLRAGYLRNSPLAALEWVQQRLVGAASYADALDARQDARFLRRLEGMVWRAIVPGLTRVTPTARAVARQAIIGAGLPSWRSDRLRASPEDALAALQRRMVGAADYASAAGLRQDARFLRRLERMVWSARMAKIQAGIDSSRCVPVPRRRASA